MHLIVVEDYDSLGRKAAEKVIETINKYKGDVNICLPTGTTPLKMYDYLTLYISEEIVDIANVNWFTLDEYIGLPENHALKCIEQLKRNFYSRVGVPQERIFTYNVTNQNHDEEIINYEQIIRNLGGLHLCVVGIGWNGHIGFNEPGSTELDSARIVKFHPMTIEQSKKYFRNESEIPKRGITLGLKNILECKEILLIASGLGKADILKRSLEGPISSEVPASILRKHSSYCVIADREAASSLTIKV